MSKYYLSWDCATKTLAYALIKIDMSTIEKIKVQRKKNAKSQTTEVNEPIANDKLVIKINEKTIKLLKSSIDIIDINCINLLPDITNDKITDIQRISALKNFLTNFKLPVEPDVVLIEHQPALFGDYKTNIASSMISHCLVYHYANYDVHLVSPKKKNNVSFLDELSYTNILDQEKEKRTSSSAARYCARKIHSTKNLLYFVEATNQKLPDINKKDDIADAFMQILGYIF